MSLHIRSNVPFFFAGVSNTTWGGLTLPLEMKLVGMKDCFLNVSPDLRIPLANDGGVARLTLAVPNNAALIGGSLFLQGVVSEPGVNPLGALSTPGCRAQFGMQ